MSTVLLVWTWYVNHLKIGHKIILAIKLIKTFKGNNDNVVSV